MSAINVRICRSVVPGHAGGYVPGMSAAYAADISGTTPPAWPGTTLRHIWTFIADIIYPRHWPPACLRSWAEFNFAGKPAVVGDENTLCEHHLRSQRTPVRRFDPYLEVKWLKIAQFDLHFEQNWVRRRSIADAPGPTGTDSRMLSVSTGNYVAGRSAGYENQA